MNYVLSPLSEHGGWRPNLEDGTEETPVKSYSGGESHFVWNSQQGIPFSLSQEDPIVTNRNSLGRESAFCPDDGFSKLCRSAESSRDHSIKANRLSNERLEKLIGPGPYDENGDVIDFILKKNQRLLAPKSVNGNQGNASLFANTSREEAERHWEDSGRISSRFESIKIELLKRSNQAAEAERLRLEQEAENSKLKAAEKERIERQRAKLKEESIRKSKIAAKVTDRAPDLALHVGSSSRKDAKKEKTTANLIDIAIARRKKFADRVNNVSEVLKNKQLRKTINGCRIIIQQLGETAQSLRLGYTGTTRNFGPGKLFTEIKTRKPELISIAHHVVAESILKYGTNNVSPDSINKGETRFALVYLTVILSINFDGFFEVFQEALCTYCPYVLPGLREAIVSNFSSESEDIEKMKEAIGYTAGESLSDYIARMQSYIGFYAGVLQTHVNILRQLDLEMSPDAAHPCPGPNGGIIEAWRWLAGMMNIPPSRWTPYLIQAFVAVCGVELNRHCGEQMKKLLRLIGGPEFRKKCKDVSDFNSSKSDNDVDRFEIFCNYFDRINGELNSQVPPPGRDGIDARSLVLDVENYGSAEQAFYG